MQKLCIFTIFDKKAVAYNQPFYYHQKGQAIRALQDNVAQVDSPISKHPEDYALYKIGEFDDQSGEISSTKPEFIEEALNLRKN